MINYENEYDLQDLDDKEKLRIINIEIDKIININNLLYNTLKLYKDAENSDCYIFASKIIDAASLNIRKMFPY